MAEKHKHCKTNPATQSPYFSNRRWHWECWLERSLTLIPLAPLGFFPPCLNSLLSLHLHSIPFLAWCLGCWRDGHVRMEKAMDWLPATWFLRAFPWSLCVALGDSPSARTLGLRDTVCARAPNVVCSSVHLLNLAGRLDGCFLVAAGFFLPFLH